MRQEEVIEERYGLALARIKEIPDESICGEAYRDYFMRMAEFVLLMDRTYELVRNGEPGGAGRAQSFALCGYSACALWRKLCESGVCSKPTGRVNRKMSVFFRYGASGNDSGSI